MIRLFIGYDRAERVAWHVLVHSIIETCSEPITVTPIGNSTLPSRLWWRTRGPYDSTEFSVCRFLVPALCEWQGWAIFMDCDMLCRDDLARLWAQRDDRYAVMVRQHEYAPKADRKFLGQRQARYPRKNWSSLMLLNCAHPDCRTLTPQYVNRAAGLDLHGFAWTAPQSIGALAGSWNELVLSANAPEASLWHYTEGGPWHGYGWRAAPWYQALDDLLGAGQNPAARIRRRGRSVVVRYAGGGRA